MEGQMEKKTNIHTLMKMENDGKGMPDYIVAAIEKATNDCGEFCNRMGTTPEVAQGIALILVLATVPASPRMEPYPAFELQVYIEMLNSAIEDGLINVDQEYLDQLEKVASIIQGQVFITTNQLGFSITMSDDENSPLERTGLLPIFNAISAALDEAQEKQKTETPITIGQYPTPNHPMVSGDHLRRLIYSLN